MHLSSDHIRLVTVLPNGEVEILFRDQTFMMVSSERVSIKNQNRYQHLHDDVQVVAEEIGIELSEEEEKRVVNAIFDFDYSDYNEYIADEIESVTGKERMEEE